MAVKTINLIILLIIQNSKKNETYRPKQKCDHWQFITIVWEDLYQRKIN